MIGLENSRYILNQSGSKLKLQLWHSRFPARYWIRSSFFFKFSVTRCSIGRCAYLRFGSPTRNQNALKMNWSFSGLTWSDFLFTYLCAWINVSSSVCRSANFETNSPIVLAYDNKIKEIESDTKKQPTI